MVVLKLIVMARMVAGGIKMATLTDFAKNPKKKIEKKMVNGIWIESEEEKKNWEAI